ncbi:MAG: hypothetical protein CMJ84_10100 [Planctomycetes bacterium]|nr:hypothetical protein [Planctomycetota bacterium]
MRLALAAVEEHVTLGEMAAPEEPDLPAAGERGAREEQQEQRARSAADTAPLKVGCLHSRWRR